MGYVKKKVNTDLLPRVKVKPFSGRPKWSICGLPSSQSYITKEGVEISICPKGHKFIVEKY